ncbi:hypothetical protein CEXT_514491 [Caerostris extrusa]|uniref:Uncharacterized protein n=1 Tax=Caerostris extrusa TaxID=172846 RepID=A0AAV4SU11_CAEEX|nr:hypothetical protein CEXT_514491 [Caerostris extrusa]
MELHKTANDIYQKCVPQVTGEYLLVIPKVEDTMANLWSSIKLQTISIKSVFHSVSSESFRDSMLRKIGDAFITGRPFSILMSAHQHSAPAPGTAGHTSLLPLHQEQTEKFHSSSRPSF